MLTRPAAVLCLLSVLVGLYHAVDAYLSMPQVFKSSDTGQCVRMVDEQGARPCPTELPKRYTTVWVR